MNFHVQEFIKLIISWYVLLILTTFVFIASSNRSEKELSIEYRPISN